MARTIVLKVIARSKRNIVEAVADGSYRVHVTSPPVDGEANKKVIELLSEHFKLPKRCFAIVRGQTNSTKYVQIEE